MGLTSALGIQKHFQIHSMELLAHSMNVAKLSQQIGERMGLSAKEQQLLYEIGFMHDIGKINIPKEVIWKPGALTPEEREVMNMHPVYSEELILEFFPHTDINLHIAKVVRHHHENWDGTGYPDKLQGNDIPLYSRIIAIADMYDAITQPRVYRPKPLRNPLRIMESELGKKLDEFIYRKYALKELKKVKKNIY